MPLPTSLVTLLRLVPTKDVVGGLGERISSLEQTAIREIDCMTYDKNNTDSVYLNIILQNCTNGFLVTVQPRGSSFPSTEVCL